jgi:hypothetical protein
MKKTHIKIIEDKERCEEVKMKQEGFDKLLKKAGEMKPLEDKKENLTNKKKK